MSQDSEPGCAVTTIIQQSTLTTLLRLTFLLALGTLGCSPPAAVPDDLSLLLVTLDTTRSDALGCYGAGDASTPNLDRLAAEGARFDTVTACTPLTLPSHCTIHTGTWPLAHGVHRNGVMPLPEGAVTVAELLRDAGIQTRAVVAAFVVKSMFGLGQGFDEYDDRMVRMDPSEPALERPGDQVADAAIVDLRELAGSRFFMWVHFYDPHLPYRSRSGHPSGSREAYLEEVTFVDEQVGRLLSELEGLGIADRTAVLVVGDHGEGLGDHGESEHGFLLYDTTLSVPMLMRCPGAVPAGAVVETRVRTVDVAPTLIELAGLPRPSWMTGESVLALAATPGPHADRLALGESVEARDSLAMARLRSLHDGQWKYVEAPHPRLYDLRTDPGEDLNLASEDTVRVAAMREQLGDLVARAEREGPGASREVDEKTADALAALGYATAGDGAGEGSTHAFDDPYAQIEVIEWYAAALRSIGSDPATAEALLREVVRTRPEAPSPLFDLTRVLRRQRREDEVVSLCREVLSDHPHARLPRLQLARLALEGGDVEGSLAAVELLLREHPDDAEVQLAAGRALRAAGELERARTHYERAAALAPADLGILIERVRLEAESGNRETAIELLERAQVADPDSRAIARELARMRREAPDS